MERLRAVRVFMSIGTGWRMISLKNFSPSSILLSHSTGWSSLRSFHQNAVLSAISEFTVASPQPPHLIAEAGLLPPSPAAGAVDSYVFA